jgi:hypothetical protein
MVFSMEQRIELAIMGTNDACFKGNDYSSFGVRGYDHRDFQEPWWI